MPITSENNFCTSWSGGKDACFALWQSIQKGFTPTCLLTMLKGDKDQTSAHGLTREVLEAQAACMQLPIIFGKASVGEYEAGLKATLQDVQKTFKTFQLAFGDIDLQAHRDWYEKILTGTGVSPAFPLWHYDRQQLLEDMFANGFETMIVSLKADKLDRNLLGKVLTPDIADTIQKQGICPTGEDGEFHTLVVNAPHFYQRLDIETGEVIEDEWGYSQLTISAA
ncbi:diphthine--ammonia ligase [Endozoicomonas atrinae]|uniref:Dph6-related ATP pyrophosphatase n=1 Tax=Endozoicomonas atrinae TaxID=1333660 RepID=UPI003AFF8B79